MTASAAEDAGQLELSLTAGGEEDGTTTLENNLAGSETVQHILTVRPSNPTCRHSPKGKNTRLHKNLCTNVHGNFICDGQKGKEPKCPPCGEWRKKLWSLRTMEDFVVVSAERTLTPAVSCCSPFPPAWSRGQKTVLHPQAWGSLGRGGGELGLRQELASRALGAEDVLELCFCSGGSSRLRALGRGPCRARAGGAGPQDAFYRPALSRPRCAGVGVRRSRASGGSTDGAAGGGRRIEATGPALPRTQVNGCRLGLSLPSCEVGMPVPAFLLSHFLTVYRAQASCWALGIKGWALGPGPCPPRDPQ